MDNEKSLTPREALEREKARLLEQAAAQAAAIDRDMAELDRLAAKYNLVLITRDGSNEPTSPTPPAASASMAAEPASDIVNTIGELVRRYRSDQRSPYQQIKHATRITYQYRLRRVDEDCGHIRVSDFKASDIQQWYERWKEGGGPSGAHGNVTLLRQLANFGASALNDKACLALQVILHGMRFQVEYARTEQLTATHAEAIRAEAHRARLHSIALAQAFQFECRLPQKDVIGEWLPLTEPGRAIRTNGDNKWVRGLCWEEIDENLKLRHKNGLRQGSVEISLKQAPMVMLELALHIGVAPGKGFTRADLPAEGPIVQYETSGMPYLPFQFRRRWREVADKAGVPPEIRNMDSRGKVKDARPAVHDSRRLNGHVKKEDDEFEPTRRTSR